MATYRPALNLLLTINPRDKQTLPIDEFQTSLILKGLFGSDEISGRKFSFLKPVGLSRPRVSQMF